MAAAGDNLIDSSLVADKESELRYIDHKESKLIYPDRETFSPSKPPRTQMDQHNNIVQNKIGVSDANETVKISVKETETGLSDSGLDSSGSSEDTTGGKFVDHQETHVPVYKPESISSPEKIVEDLFSFVDEPQSLDAVNNNSEMNTQTSQISETIKSNSVTGECYLGMEVDLHKPEKTAEPKTTVVEQNSAEMNLYWYNKTVDLDPSELESFKNGQGDACTSSLQMYVGDRYFGDKLETTKTVETGDNHQTTARVSEKKETREKWSPSLESASSRFLNLASEMKSDTKPKSSTVPAGGTSVDSSSQHPWGLDGDNKVLVITEDNDIDELPVVPLLTPETAIADDVDGDVPEEDDDDIDVTDAMGYMELKDKEKIVQAMKDADAKDEDKTDNENSKMEGMHDQSDKNDNIDIADAIGYMEIKDKNKTNEASSLVGGVKQQSLTETDVREQANDSTTNETDTDKNFQKESEHIVSSVVQKVHSQMMRSSGDFKSEEYRSVSKAQDQDTVDGSDRDTVMEETIEITSIKQVESSIFSDTSVNKEELFEPVEVRRKFRIDGDVENKLEKLGANIIEVENLIDEYLDDDSYSLCLSDCWLRLRNKKFEMKVNETLHSSSKLGMYNEIQIEQDVRQYLLKKFADKLNGNQDQDLPLDVIVDRLGLTEFATFETVKKSYQLDQCTVDLEMTDPVPQVCQVEVTVDRPSQILQALDTISNVAHKLDLKPLQYL